MCCYDTTLYYVRVFLILYIYDYGYDAYDYRELRVLRKQHHNLTFFTIVNVDKLYCTYVYRAYSAGRRAVG